MLLEDAPGTSQTIYLSVGVEEMPLLDESTDVVICRNALDHMLDPELAVEQLWRLLKSGGLLYVSVDIGGAATPDEPSPFTKKSLSALVCERFETLSESDGHLPHAKWRDDNVRLLLKKKGQSAKTLNNEQILKAYEDGVLTQGSTDGVLCAA